VVRDAIPTHWPIKDNNSDFSNIFEDTHFAESTAVAKFSISLDFRLHFDNRLTNLLQDGSSPDPSQIFSTLYTRLPNPML
jgi:hypothetical protein